ncbi:hypothetical protein N431DRAFT_320891 [Stipitochalara longipes BDJ]|nr:hypothetical protein N431DRAFT_320891 [Stipitochalara longipes BDJ]
MFYQHNNGSTTLPRGFRFHEPRTPEPQAEDEPQIPSPPRPRLKVRRRNVSNLQAPTDHFLASVAAADVPIPTIELPQVTQNISEDQDMPDREDFSNTSGLLAPQPQDYKFFSPPKTPMPTFPSEEGASRPDWSMGTPSPAEDYFQRPSSALSNASSDDSFYSGSRFSRPSDDGSCTSPESDIADPFQFPISKAKGKSLTLDEPVRLTTLNGKLRSKTRKDAKWTQAQSAHLWSTYLLYLQDPTVTPFRIGASCVPPEGVCHRVARETKRSWKGQKVAPVLRRSSRLSSVVSSRASEKSGSLTPTGEKPKVYAAWPHSSAATRNHLREMCRNKDNTPVSRHRHMQSRSPTPFTNKTVRARQTPEPRGSMFSTIDIAMSLTTSTAESMQPDGPLAKLAVDNSEDTPTLTSSFPPLEVFKPLSFGESRGLGINLDENRGRRLGSPFTARTYGPSSSTTLNTFDRPSPPRTQSDTVSGPQLRSPLRFEQPRSLNGTQKRRAQHDLEEELSPNGAIVRPSILNEQLFSAGTPLNQRRVRSRGFSLGDEAFRHREPGISPSKFEAPPPRMRFPSPTPLPPKPAPKLLPSATFEPRLGSPFTEAGPSTFPRRLFQDPTATVRRSAFATMHQTRRSIESFDFGEGPSLQSRLEQLDMKLKQIRERDASSKGKRQSSE